MTSKEEPLFVPTSAQPKWPGVSSWDSIFSTVRAQVPSLDSDEASLSDCDDEEVHIFQREDICFVPDLSEELLDEQGDFGTQGDTVTADLQSISWVEPERGSCGNSDLNTMVQKHNMGQVSPRSISEIELLCPAEAIRKAFHSPDDIDGSHSGHLHLSLGDCVVKENPSHNDTGIDLQSGDLDPNSLDTEQEVYAIFTSTAILLRKLIYSNCSLVFIKSVENWDLDTVLQQLEEIGQGYLVPDMDPDCSADPEMLPPPLPPIENYSAKRDDRIMKQLVELSARQFQALPHDQQLAMESQEGASSKSPIRPELLQEDLSKWVSRRRKEKVPTVYIDLRSTHFRTEAKTQGDEEPGASTEERKTSKSELTGKSLLLHQLRHTKSVPPSNINDPDVLQPEEDQESMDSAPQIQRKRRLKPTTKSTPKVHIATQREKRVVATEDEAPEDTEKAHSPQPSPIKVEKDPSREETERKDKQVKEKKNRQRMQVQLEGLKPRSSVNGRQPMAEETIVLFHPETSYCPDIRTLPASLGSSVEMVLLTVRLSSCGQVTMPGHGNRSSDSALSIANTYNALLTWLLSLVPALNPQNTGDTPFQVLGFQQMWREEGLVLFACLSPRDVPTHSSPKIRKHKGKEDLRGTSSFYQQVSLYLTHNTLKSVTWWTDEVARRMQGQLFPLHLEVPAVKLSSIMTLNPAAEAVEKAFTSPAGFYWQTLETEEKFSPLGLEVDSDNETEVVSVILFDTLLRDPAVLYHVLQLILMKGLDVGGLRLLYPESSVLNLYIDPLPSSYTGRDVQTPPVLALALRGPGAGETWGEISGPCDPQLARLTDQYSLNALYGSRREEPILQYSRRSGCLSRDLSLWFGGRIPSVGNVNIGIQNPLARRTDSCRSPALLTATIKGDVFLVVSPAVPPFAYGDVIDICARRGFALQGIRRLWLAGKRAAMLSMSPNQVPTFCPNKPSTQHAMLSRCHSLLLLFRKENASHHIPALIQGLMNGLAEQGLLGAIRTHFPPNCGLNPSLCFHAAPYSDCLLQCLGGSLHAVPDASSVTMEIFTRRPFTSDPEMEQVALLTMSGKQTLRRGGHLLRRILRPLLTKPKSSVGSEFPKFELLGLKWMPGLSRLQAKEITPYEVGDGPWQRSVEQLTSNPALLCVLRRVNGFNTLKQAIQELVPLADRGPPQLIMSATQEIAFRQAALTFTDKELVSDPQSRSILKYIAPPWITSQSGGGEDRRTQSESIFTYMISGPPLLYTILLLKPGTWSHAIGKILRKAEQQRFHVVGMKPVTLTPLDFHRILPENVKQDKSLCSRHCDYLTSAPCLVLCLRTHNAVLKLLDLLGPEDPDLCKAQDQFLWRAQYGTSSVQNGMYASTSYEAAIQDLKCFFPEGLPCDQSSVLESEQIPRLAHDAIFNSRALRRVGKKPLQGQSPTLDRSFISALGQTTCLLFPPCTVSGCSPPYIHGLEKLIGRDFCITGARLTAFDQSQALFVTELCKPKDSLSTEFRALAEGPCLLVAAQRDNAVSCFSSLMDSTRTETWRDSASPSFTPGVMCPQTEAQANKMICCFFDSLTPDSIHQIALQDL
ncbi:dynein axonemal assembly factor 8-like [Pelodytes ibericus]